MRRREIESTSASHLGGMDPIYGDNPNEPPEQGVLVSTPEMIDPARERDKPKEQGNKFQCQKKAKRFTIFFHFWYYGGRVARCFGFWVFPHTHASAKTHAVLIKSGEIENKKTTDTNNSSLGFTFRERPIVHLRSHPPPANASQHIEVYPLSFTFHSHQKQTLQTHHRRRRASSVPCPCCWCCVTPQQGC